MASMAEAEDFPTDDGFEEPDANGWRSDDFNDALKHGFRRAGMHWMRAGYELLAGVGALLEELNQKASDPEAPDDGAERIDLE